MPDRETRVVCHLLAIHPIVKPMSKRKHKFKEEKRTPNDEDVKRITRLDFITEVKYP